MSRGYRLFITALIGCLTLGAVASEPRHQSAQTGARSSDQQSAQKLANSPQQITPTLNKIIYTEKNQNPCGDRWSDKHSDLCASWQSADAAQDAAKSSRIAAFAAIVAAIVSVIGTILLIATFAQANKVARRELQPYIFVTGTKIKMKFIENRREWDVWVKMMYCNSGNTPAINVRIKAYAIQLANGKEPDFSHFGIDRLIGPLGPDDERSMDIEVAVDPECTSATSNKIHLFGRIDFDDEFRSGHWITFHSYFGGDAKRGKIMWTADTWNDYGPVDVSWWRRITKRLWQSHKG